MTNNELKTAAETIPSNVNENVPANNTDTTNKTEKENNDMTSEITNEMTDEMTTTNNSANNNITKSILKLMRAMRRRPVTPANEFPPAVGRLLHTLSKHDGASPAELCEALDVRPSSMSELLSRVEAHGLITRTVSETDKRATKVFLSEAGTAAVEQTRARFREENDKLAACFTEEELAQFITLCDKLSAHLEEIAGPEKKDCCGRRGHHHGPHFGPCGHHRMHGPHFGPCGHHRMHGPHFGHCGHHRLHGPCGHRPEEVKAL